MRLEGETLHLSGGSISDLFFNMQHDDWSRLHVEAKDERVDRDELEKAIRKDADEFYRMLGIEPDDDRVNALTADFFRRV